MIIDGKIISNSIREELKRDSLDYFSRYGKKPGLAVIIVGDDPASRVYVNGKKKACDELGFYSIERSLPADVSQVELLNIIDEFNEADEIDGILVQLPLSAHISENEVISRIRPDKDVDGFHPINVGSLMTGKKCLKPCTPSGIIELIKRTGIEISGKNAVVVGRSNIVGKPVAMMLLSENATVTVCHSKTKNIKEICASADILIAAVGKAEMIRGDWIKPGAVVIDVGINRMADKKILGDVCFAEAIEKAGYITPVPGGVGPMTITMLMKNTLEAAIALRS